VGSETILYHKAFAWSGYKLCTDPVERKMVYVSFVRLQTQMTKKLEKASEKTLRSERQALSFRFL